MKIFSILSCLWLIFVDILIIFVVLAIFDSVSSYSEQLIVSLIVLCYSEIILFRNTWGRNAIGELIILTDDLKKIRVLLKEEIDDFHNDCEKEGLEKAKNEFGKISSKFWIQAVFITIIQIMAIINLLGAL